MFTIARDGVTVVTVSTEFDALAWFHKHTSSSSEWACKHEGYAVVERTPVTRADYMAESAAEWQGPGASTGEAHARYYSQFVTAQSLEAVSSAFTLDELRSALREDRYLNTIPLHKWDSLTWHPTSFDGGFAVHFPYDKAMKKVADSYGMTRAEIVCIAKQAARLLVERSNA